MGKNGCVMRDAWWESDGPELADDVVPWTPVLIVLVAALCFWAATWALGVSS